MEEVAEGISKFGGLVILAALAVWLIIQDRTKNTKLLEELTKTNEDNSRAIDALVESNKNIATSLELLKGSLGQANEKLDKTYDELEMIKISCQIKNIEDKIVKKELVPLMEPFYRDEILYWTSDEFSNRAVFDDCVLSISFDELNSKFNEDKFNPVDGRLVRVADHLSALLEAHLSIQYGITSKQLENGRSNILKGYEAGKKINGIDAGSLFADFISE